MTERIGKFAFFVSFWEAASDLNDADRLAFYDAICAYAFTGEEPSFKGIMGTVWKLVKPNIDSSLKGQKTGGKGGRPKVEKPTEKPPVSKGKNPPSKKSKTTPETDMDRDRDRDMEVEEFVPLERTNSSTTSASAATAAAGAAPPPRKESKPFCPMCDTPVWKNTQTGRYRCGTCFDEYDEGKAVWR